VGSSETASHRPQPVPDRVGLVTYKVRHASNGRKGEWRTRMSTSPAIGHNFATLPARSRIQHVLSTAGGQWNFEERSFLTCLRPKYPFRGLQRGRNCGLRNHHVLMFPRDCSPLVEICTVLQDSLGSKPRQRSLADEVKILIANL
jgi:hypothetical protein